jgi:hypothetical protein
MKPMATNAEYLTGMQSHLRKWDAEVGLLLAQSKKADGEIRTAYERRLKELRLCRKAAQKSYDELRVATGATGDKMQAGLQAAWETMQATLERVSSDLGEMARKEATPTKAAPIQAAPVEPASAEAGPAQAAPTQAVPPQAAPLQQETAP